MKMIKGTGTLLLVQPLKLLIKYFTRKKSALLLPLQVLRKKMRERGKKRGRERERTLFYKKRLALRTNKRKKDLIIIKNPFVSATAHLIKTG